MSSQKWPVIRLSETAEKIMVGIASAATHAYSQQGVVLLRNLNIKEGWIDESDILYIDHEYEYQHRNKRLRAGDVITVRTGYPGISAVVPEKYQGAQCFTSLIIRPNLDKLVPEFLCQVLNSEYGKRHVAAGEAGGAQKNLNASTLEAFPVPLPTVREQHKAVSLLEIWDTAIATTERLLSNCRKQKQVLMQQLLTGKRRLQKFVVSSERLTTRFGSIPADWRHVPIEQVAQEFSAKNGADRQLPVLSCTKHAGLVDSLSYFNKQVFSQDVSTYKLVERGCFAYATNHIDEGSIGYQNFYDEALISPMYTVFKPGNEIDHGFLFKLLKTEHYRQIFAANTNASVDRRGSLRWGDFKKIEIPLPSLAEQVVISGIIDSAQLEVESIERQLEKLKDEKRALIQQLLTGKRRVRLPSAEAASA